MNKTEYAVQYAKKGLSVIPLYPDSKIPTMKHKDKPPLDQHKIELIFNNHPDLNIGVKMVDLFVIDIDSPEHGEKNIDGFQSIKDIPDKLLPVTLTSTSPTGGKHYFYLKRNGKPHESFIDWRKGVDIVAGKNNLTVVPPSTKNGKPYQWVNPKQEIVTAPQDLIDLIEHDYQQKHSTKTIKVDYSPINGKKWTGIVLDNLVQGAPEGQRNDYMTRICGQMIHAGADDNTVWQLLQFANSFNTPPLENKELEKILSSIIREEIGKS